jgi:hypothetical protein
MPSTGRKQPRRRLVARGGAKRLDDGRGEPATVERAHGVRSRRPRDAQFIDRARQEGTVVERRRDGWQRLERHPIDAHAQGPGHAMPAVVDHRERVRRHADRQQRRSEVGSQRIVQQQRRRRAEFRRRASELELRRWLRPRTAGRSHDGEQASRHASEQIHQQSRTDRDRGGCL